MLSVSAGTGTLGCRERGIERVDPAQQAAELEATEDLLQGRAVGRRRDQLRRVDPERQVAPHGREELRVARLVGVLLHGPAARGRQLVGVGDHVLERAVLRDQLAGGLVADPRDARDVVRRVALEPDEVRHLVGPNAVAELDALGRVDVDLCDAARRHHQRDVLAAELECVAVGRDDARLDARLVGARRDRRDHVVRLPALELEVPVAERLDDRTEVRELLPQQVRHRPTALLVRLRDLRAVGRTRVPRDGDAARRVVREQLEEHVREAEQRVRRLPVRRLRAPPGARSRRGTRGCCRRRGRARSPCAGPSSSWSSSPVSVFGLTPSSVTHPGHSSARTTEDRPAGRRGTHRLALPWPYVCDLHPSRARHRAVLGGAPGRRRGAARRAPPRAPARRARPRPAVRGPDLRTRGGRRARPCGRRVGRRRRWWTARSQASSSALPRDASWGPNMWVEPAGHAAVERRARAGPLRGGRGTLGRRGPHPALRDAAGFRRRARRRVVPARLRPPAGLRDPGGARRGRALRRAAGPDRPPCRAGRTSTRSRGSTSRCPRTRRSRRSSRASRCRPSRMPGPSTRRTSTTRGSRRSSSSGTAR